MSRAGRLRRLVPTAIAATAVLASGAVLAAAGPANRVTLSLDGTWRIADGTDPARIPNRFDHRVPVPGLAHSATPHFAGVDEYQSKQLLDGMVRNGLYAQADYDRLGDARGITKQTRRYFWYRRTFSAPAKHAVAILRIAKAQFGTAVFLNGVDVGGHDGCFTAAYLDVSKAIRWNARNDLVIRIGAHPGVLPAKVTCGTDFEKNRWTPGIYDDVTLMASDNPAIATVQVAPHIGGPGQPAANIVVQTELHNYGDSEITTQLRQQISERVSGKPVGAAATLSVAVPAGGSRTVTQTVPVPGARLWSPDDPFLYSLETATSGDSARTRFGMREFRFDTPTQRAYLNGRPIFLRGSNIALHRFFEDPEVGTLPWDEKWLRRLLVELPRELHWNAFRFSIGPVPDRWLEIADENGLLVQNEYAIWTGSPLWTKLKASYDYDQLTVEFREWMRDNWNHPSVVIWDASNESDLPELARKVVPAVRGLDLSNRPWEDSYNGPIGPDDPVEDHQYLFEASADGFDNGAKPFALTDLETMIGPQVDPFLKTAHARILNEYAWLWLNRDGSPTLLTNKLYPKLLGARDNTENRRDLYAYLVAGETEFWRAYRHYAGVMHFPYLTASDPQGYTSDQFVDLRSLTLEPHFKDALKRSFDPLGVYLNFWQPAIDAGRPRELTVAMVNDEDRTRAGRLRFVFVDAADRRVDVGETPFSLPPLGAQTYQATVTAPAAPGDYRLEAVAVPDDAPDHPVASRRTVTLRAAAK